MEIIIKNYLKTTRELIDSLDFETLQKIINRIKITRYSYTNKILIAGNGGSATTASHFAEDLNGTKKFKAISLCNDIGFITATANDFDYDYIFKRQLEYLYNNGDILIVISASGNSNNLIDAVDYINNKNGLTIGLLGFDGGLLKNRCQMSLVFESPIGMYGSIEDLHLITTHIITEYFRKQKELEKI